MNWLLLRPAQALRVGAVACALAVAPAARADQIDRVLVADSGAVAEKVAALKGKHIAVLPFQVQVGDRPATFRQGVAGVQMANKLQNLLVLTNPAGQAGEYVVLGDAARTAAEAGKRAGKAIDWTTPAGRQALLGLQLPVVWDADTFSTPDTYLTGVLKVSADLKTATVVLQTFSPADPEPKTLCLLQESPTAGIRVDRNTLADLGRSFAVAKAVTALDHPATPQGRTRAVAGPDEAASEAAGRPAAVSPTAGGAIAVPDCPVELTVRYNGRPVRAEVDGSGSLRLTATPPPNARIDFHLVNTGDKPVAVVLTVDGKNVIQLNPDERAEVNADRERYRKFVLEPRAAVPLYKVEGWLKSTDGVASTRYEPILADAETSSAVRFATMAPPTAGRIELLVFPANDGVVPAVTPGTAAATPDRPTRPAATAVPDADPVAQQDQATDAGAMEQMDKSIGKTRSAAAARELVLSKLPAGTVVVSAATGGRQIRLPAAKGKGGKTKGLALDGGGVEYDGDVAREKGFVSTALPAATVVVTYYTPDMVGAPIPAGGN